MLDRVSESPFLLDLAPILGKRDETTTKEREEGVGSLNFGRLVSFGLIEREVWVWCVLLLSFPFHPSSVNPHGGNGESSSSSHVAFVVRFSK